jgi:hypothetical protein
LLLAKTAFISNDTFEERKFSYRASAMATRAERRRTLVYIMRTGTRKEEVIRNSTGNESLTKDWTGLKGVNVFKE